MSAQRLYQQQLGVLLLIKQSISRLQKLTILNTFLMIQTGESQHLNEGLRG